MPDDTPTAIVARRIRAVLQRAHAQHAKAHEIAATAYAGPVAPPAGSQPAPVVTTTGRGAP